jgi:aminopeptidase
MSDPRFRRLADLLVSYSCALQPGDKVLIEAIEIPDAFVRELVRAAAAVGALPFVTVKSQVLTRELILQASEEQMRIIGAVEAERMRQMNAYLGVRGSANVSEMAGVPREKMALYEAHVLKPVHMEIRVPKTRWCVLRWPNAAMAQLAQVATEDFERFYFDVCTLDYARMSRAMKPLQDLMMATDRVRLVSPGTDLTFSIKGIPAVPCDGRFNIPDGEVFTAPVRDSVNGTIQFNATTIYRGVTHDRVRLAFRDGKIVDATSNDTDHLNKVLDADEGARYVGEFAIGFNPYITKPMKDILFDEKIAGSLHFTPGNAYQEAWNGNTSQIHWDLVLMQDTAAGGGEIWFDDRLIRKDGRFVVPELAGLNPEQLIG